MDIGEQEREYTVPAPAEIPDHVPDDIPAEPGTAPAEPDLIPA